MEKINIAQILKDSPKRTKLYSPICGYCELSETGNYLIKVLDTNANYYNFYYDGSYVKTGECLLFPSKDNRDWNTFQRPFKDGDIVTYEYENGLESIILNKFVNFVEVHYHCALYDNAKGFVINNYIVGEPKYIRFATEEEKQKLFQAIKDNGYEWDPDTKTLNEFKIKKGKWYVCIKKWYDEYDNEIFHKGYTYYSPENGKLMPGNSNIPREILCGDEYFREWTISDAKDGDVLYSDVNDNGDDDDCYKYVFILKEINGNMVIAHCFINVDRFIPTETYLVENIYPIRLATEEEKARLFQAIKDYGYKWNPKTKTLKMLIEPKFKVGDIIRLKEDDEKPFYKIINIKNDCYITDQGELSFRYEYLWELVPNKFDINTLQPFESRVLVRDKNTDKWKSNFWGFYDIDNAMNYPYECCGNSFAQCIPYEGNEHLLGTTNDCDEFYKTWE